MSRVHHVPAPPQTSRDTTLRNQYLVLRDEEPWGQRCRDAARLHEQERAAEEQERKEKNRAYARELAQQVEERKQFKSTQKARAAEDARVEREAAILSGMTLEAYREHTRATHSEARDSRKQQLLEARAAQTALRQQLEDEARKIREETDRIKREEREATQLRKQTQRDHALETLRSNNELKKQHALVKKHERLNDVELLKQSQEIAELEQRKRVEERERRMLPRIAPEHFVPLADAFATPKYEKYFAAQESPRNPTSSKSGRSNRKLTPREIAQELKKQVSDADAERARQKQLSIRERETLEADATAFHEDEKLRQFNQMQRKAEYRNNLRDQLLDQRRREHDSLVRRGL